MSCHVMSCYMCGTYRFFSTFTNTVLKSFLSGSITRYGTLWVDLSGPRFILECNLRLFTLNESYWITGHWMMCVVISPPGLVQSHRFWSVYSPMNVRFLRILHLIYWSGPSIWYERKRPLLLPLNGLLYAACFHLLLSVDVVLWVWWQLFQRT